MTVRIDLAINFQKTKFITKLITNSKMKIEEKEVGQVYEIFERRNKNRQS